MKFIIHDYISTLKEEKELEDLVKNILIQKGHIIDFSPTKGVRQNGKDLQSKKENKEYIFVIKQGDIGRENWDSKTNSIRQTINEILDFGIKKGTKIVVVANGYVKQTVEQLFFSYIKNNSQKYGVDIVLWNIDELVQLAENYLINENIFTDEIQELFRRSFIFMAENDNKLSQKYFLNLVELIFKNEVDKKRELNKLIQTANLIINIILNWCRKENNIRPMIYCADIMILNLLRYQKKYNSNFVKNKIEINNLLDTYFKIYQEFIEKIICCLTNPFGIMFGKKNNLLGRIEFWEILKIILMYIVIFENYMKVKKQEEIQVVIQLLITFLKTNGVGYYSLMYPLYDDNIIEINLTMLILLKFGNIDIAKKFLVKLNKNIINRIEYKNIFPFFYREEYKKIVEYELGLLKEENKVSSTIFYNLFFWAAYLNDDSLYTFFYTDYLKIKEKIFINYEMIACKEVIEIVDIKIPEIILDFKKSHNKIIKFIKNIKTDFEEISMYDILESLIERTPMKNKIFYEKFCVK